MIMANMKKFVIISLIMFVLSPCSPVLRHNPDRLQVMDDTCIRIDQGQAAVVLEAGAW
jgi:hypothetical protein